MVRTRSAARRLGFGEDQGAGLVEYALLVLLVAIALVVAVGALGTAIASSLSDAASRFP
jgi:Flp pilus assembly pilin Flp